MAVTVQDLIDKVPDLGSRNGEVIQFHLDAAIAMIPESVPDDARRDLAIAELVQLSLQPTGVSSVGNGGTVYRGKEAERQRILRNLTGATVLVTEDQYNPLYRYGQ